MRMASFEIQRRFPASLAVFSGHFPGSPLLPGAILLAEIQTAFNTHHSISLGKLSKVRFLQPIKPEQTITINVAPVNEKYWRFKACNATTLCCSGLIHIDKLPNKSTDIHCTTPQHSDARSLYTKLPYANNMRLIDRVLTNDTQHLTAIASGLSNEQHPLNINNKHMPTLSLLEYAAQATALHGVLNNSATLRSPRLVACKKLELHRDSETDTLHVSIRLKAQSDNGAAYGFTLAQSEAVLLRGEILLQLKP